MAYSEIYNKEKVASNYKIANFIFTTFLVTTAGLVSLYQKDELGTLFVIGIITAMVLFTVLLRIVWINNSLINKLKTHGPQHH